MLNHDPLASQRTISLLFLFGQRMVFGFLERGLAVLMQLCQTLVTSFCQDQHMLYNIQFVVLEKPKAMLFALAKGSSYNAASSFLVVT